jgi:hypothetical protein
MNELIEQLLEEVEGQVTAIRGRLDLCQYAARNTSTARLVGLLSQVNLSLAKHVDDVKIRYGPAKPFAADMQDKPAKPAKKAK